MRCIFCKSNSEGSGSKEHIIPETLGNTSLLLRPGIVCDRCNNYFSRKVEAPLLNHPSMVTLRFHQALRNKRGRVPTIKGIITPGVEAIVGYDPDSGRTDVQVDPIVIPYLAQAKAGRLYIPLHFPVPTDATLSRFLAKIALECMAKRLEEYPDGIDYLVDEPQLDSIRNHARLGSSPIWPVSARALYDANGKLVESDGREVQLIHESDFLVTEEGEWYFIIALFGQEYSINMGEPDIEGYQRWLSEHGNDSPLYSGKNKAFVMPR